MFDSLKKRLKEALNKASAVVSKKEEHIAAEPNALQKEIPEELALEPVTKEAIEKIKPLIEKAKVEEVPEIIEKEPEKKSLLHGLIKRVVEKKLSEGDVEPVIKELRKALLENDVALEAAEKICDETKAELLGKDVSRGKVGDSIKAALGSAILDVMQQDTIDIEDAIRNKSGPYLIMFFGFNGVGKTTTMAKIAHKYKKYNPILAAGDTFRAASIEQLEEHARRLGVELVKHKYGADSAAVIFDAVKHAAAKGGRLVLADTAGRNHSNVNLMDELKKVVRVNKPDLKILVLDSLTGNDIYDQSRLFNEAVGVDAIVLTKADVYQKGGAALSAAHTIKKPVLFLGVGQGYDDLKEFNAEEIVENLLN